MNKVYLALAFMMVFLLPLVNAETQSLEPIDQHKCALLIQTCSNCTYVNISSVTYPNSSIAVGQRAMTRTNNTFTYNYCDTRQLGTYNVCGYSDATNNPPFCYSFEVNSDGRELSPTFLFLIFLIVIGLIVLGFAVKEGWFVVMGGMGLMVLGLYLFVNGIAGFRDPLLTRTFSMLILGAGMYLTVQSALEMIDEVDLG